MKSAGVLQPATEKNWTLLFRFSRYSVALKCRVHGSLGAPPGATGTRARIRGRSDRVRRSNNEFRWTHEDLCLGLHYHVERSVLSEPDSAEPGRGGGQGGSIRDTLIPGIRDISIRLGGRRDFPRAWARPASLFSFHRSHRSGRIQGRVELCRPGRGTGADADSGEHVV